MDSTNTHLEKTQRESQEMFELTGKYAKAKVMIDNVESTVIAQVIGILNHPTFNDINVRIMPDTHAGKGCVVGFTAKIDLKNPQIIPNLIGVDISCGMISINIGNTLPMSIAGINTKIQETIPLGFSVNSKPKVKLNKAYDTLAKKVGANYSRVLNAVGSVGGGNHFIELGISSSGSTSCGDYWLTIHTGSRNLGKCVCEYHQDKALAYISKKASCPVDEFKKIYSGEILGRKIKEFNDAKPKVDKDLCYLEGDGALEYLEDMKLCQEYASLNRETIINEIVKACGFSVQDKIASIHNFIDFNDGILRKGAIRSYLGERMVIPFNMRDGLLLCEGKSNVDWNYSAPHGAGRVMSRSVAKKTVSLDDYKTSMSGVFSTCVNENTIDESPMAYKDAAVIEEAIKDTCTIIEKVKPILNIKAGGD